MQVKKASAGSNWYNLPATIVTPELKRDLQLLRMRSVLDPKVCPECLVLYFSTVSYKSSSHGVETVSKTFSLTFHVQRHYKKEGTKPQIPEFSQVGTIIEGPTEFFSARLSNKDRKRTFVEEVLASEKASGRFRNKYGEIQASKTSGKKDFYKKLKAKRRGTISKG
jgi:hypothetical protein